MEEPTHPKDWQRDGYIDSIAAFAVPLRVELGETCWTLALRPRRYQIEAIARQAPFCTSGLADFRVIELRASQKAKDIEARIAKA